MKTKWIALLTGGVLMHSLAFADVSYQETTQVTGGSLMGMLKMAGAFSSQAKQVAAPVTSTVMIHGGRMLHSNPHTTEIIDLDQQTITFIDHDKRTYSLVTFKEIQDQMAQAAAKSKGAQPSSSNGSQISFAAHISSNGTTREIDGKTAKEALLTLTMVSNASDSSNAKAGMLSHVFTVGCTTWGCASPGGAQEGVREDERPAGAPGYATRYDGGWATAAASFDSASAAKPECRIHSRVACGRGYPGDCCWYRNPDGRQSDRPLRYIRPGAFQFQHGSAYAPYSLGQNSSQPGVERYRHRCGDSGHTAGEPDTDFRLLRSGGRSKHFSNTSGLQSRCFAHGA
jgi:hypothetical protein